VRWILILTSLLMLCDTGSSQSCSDPATTVKVRVSWICPAAIPSATDDGANSKGLICGKDLGDATDPQGSAFVKDALERANQYLPVCLQLSGAVVSVIDERLAERSKDWKDSDQYDYLGTIKGKAWNLLDVVVVEALHRDRPTGIPVGYSSVAYDFRTTKNIKKFGGVTLNRDGIWIARKSLPQKTLPHEVGHWLGLLHTFVGCDNFGDDIEDTDPEAQADEDFINAAVPRDSQCTGFKGVLRFQFGKSKWHTSCNLEYNEKSLYNLMEYTSCRREFSPLQTTIMNQVWTKRQSLAGLAGNN
jgi:pregnancy-associated plasma protein-A